MTQQVDTSTLERAVRLLSEYANSGVPDAVSLECAQVCGKLRDALAQPQPSATCQPNPETGDISPERVTSVDMSQPSLSAGEVLELLALMVEAKREADALPEGSDQRRARFTEYVNYEHRLRQLDPAHLRALAAPQQPAPEREALVQRIAEMREHHEGVKKRARARMEEAGDVPVKAYYAKMFDTHSIIAGELEELAALAAPADAGGEA